MYYAIVLRLLAQNDAKLPANTGNLTNGVFYDIFKQIDPPTATDLHQQKIKLPVTVSPLLNAQFKPRTTYIKAGKTYYLRFTLLKNDLFAVLSQHFLRGSALLPIHINTATFEVTDVITSPQGHPRAGYSDAKTLYEQTDTSSSELTLEFGTPTTFTIGYWQDGKRRFLLFPEPVAVWSRWRKTWAKMGGEDPGLEFDQWVAENVSIVQHDLRTYPVKYSSRYTLIGFSGYARYRCNLSQSHNWQHWWHVLAAFGHYAGCGYHTAQGMGQVNYLVETSVKQKITNEN